MKSFPSCTKTNSCMSPERLTSFGFVPVSTLSEIMKCSSRLLVFCACFVILRQLPALPAVAFQQTAAPADEGFVDVFVPGNDPYPAIRIPSLVVTGQGTLLAFAEGRQGGDHSDNDMILKRSTDNGRTWGELQVLNHADGPSLNNPQAVVLESGRIMLMYQKNSLGERAAKPGAGPDAYSNWIQFSDDDGVTWSEPRDITAGTKRESGVTSVASGPGVGIVLQRSEKYGGRIVMPMNQGPWENWFVYAAYSDDGGETWSIGDIAPTGDGPGMANEVQMVERCDGSILLNARIQSGKRWRKSAVSTDGGETWTPCQDVPALVDPVCQASLLRYSWPEEDGSKHGTILFSNPATSEGRHNGGMRISRDDGDSWSEPKTIYAGPFAYSCLTRMPDNRVGILFEKDGYKTISFTCLSLDDR